MVKARLAVEFRPVRSRVMARSAWSEHPTSGSQMSRAFVATRIRKVRGHFSDSSEDTLAVEEPLEIQLGYGPAGARATKSISVTMRTPGYDFELAAGFLMTEGVVRDSADIERIDYAPESARAAAEADGEEATVL